MSDYNVNYTDKNTTPIPMPEGTENDTALDISLFGNTFLEYGQELNENILHLLETFSCAMNTGNTLNNATPDTHTANGSYNNLLTKPTTGQLWYNSSLKHLYYWNGARWLPITTKNDVAANWGVIAHGQSLPRPVSLTSGYVFPYSECIWSVSPANFNGAVDYLVCTTNQFAQVDMQYRPTGGSINNGVANYLIIGIRGNVNSDMTYATTPPSPSTTLSATPPATPSNTPTHSQTPSVTPSPTQTPFPSGTVPPTPSHTPSVTPTRTRTPAAPTPTASRTRTPAAPTPSHTPAAPTPSASGLPPTPTASPIHTLTLTSYTPSTLSLTGSNGAVGSGHTVTATTGTASVSPTGGVPPYTYSWQYFAGSTAFSIPSPNTASTAFHANGVTPTIAGGHCDGCTTEEGCPAPGGENVTCAQVRCKITDSVGSSIFSPVFALTFTFVNTA